jgi:SAM-dependent methyltransferase
VSIYDPACYLNVGSVDEAIDVILCPTEGMTSKQRWNDETRALMRLMERYIVPESMVLDYGCGIGRLAKPLIESLRCTVVGVDISRAMRVLAIQFVDNPMFCALDPRMFDKCLGNCSFDAAIAVWALQHCIDLTDVIGRLEAGLARDGKLIVVNAKYRCIPVENNEWVDDGHDVDRMIIESGFSVIDRGRLDESIAPGWMQTDIFWAVYRKDSHGLRS